jgi:serine protease AprX
MLKRELTEKLIYGHEFAGRFTQDSPILPDVWIKCAEKPTERHDLLITPYLEAGASRMSAGRLSRELRERLDREAATPVWRRLHASEDRPAARVAYNQSTLAAWLTFDEVVRVLLPLSKWWTDRVIRHGLDRWLPALSQSAAQEIQVLAEILATPQRIHELSARQREYNWLSLDVIWMVRVIGTIGLAMEVTGEATAKEAESPSSSDVLATVWPKDLLDRPARAGEAEELRERRLDYYRRIVKKVADLLEGLVPTGDGSASIYTVSLNRKAGTTVWRSTMAVKADAACRVFDLSCRDLSWAIIDSGIDARHPAFRKRYTNRTQACEVLVPLPQKIAADTGDPHDSQADVRHKQWREENPNKVRKTDWSERTRIVATYDFTIIRTLLAADGEDHTGAAEGVQERLDAIEKRLKKSKKSRLSSQLRNSLQSGREIDWSLLEELIRIPHNHDYEVPNHDHGTHVAGILGADWRKTDGDDMFPASANVRGLCPDINLYDLRVLDANGEGDEFSVMAALQFVRSLNAQKDYMVVHGVNLSLSIPHDVANYACGRTPVCEECERLVGAGIVVVAAAGNDGYLQYMTAKGLMEGYRSISITDPGNAEGVITVGSTHRDQPHTYGVSYFSSRGPTGDGRAKPDLVAPGEKIEAPVPFRDLKRKDGTSMAAPHVSGAAALIIARHRELTGQPKRIKEILCRSATDLGRERYFQGAGMLDVLRALQSV